MAGVCLAPVSSNPNNVPFVKLYESSKYSCCAYLATSKYSKVRARSFSHPAVLRTTINVFCAIVFIPISTSLSVLGMPKECYFYFESNLILGFLIRIVYEPENILFSWESKPIARAHPLSLSTPLHVAMILLLICIYSLLI